MEKVNGVPIYLLGYTIGMLQAQLSSNPKISALTAPTSNILSNLEYFITQIQILPLSKESAINAKKEIERIIGSRSNQQDFILSQNDINALFYAIFSFQSVLTTELPQINAFFINQKRAFNMTTLINKGEDILSKNDLDLLEPLTKQIIIDDIREAAKSLAYEVYTAVGFHIYRAIESIILKDYFVVLEIESKTWEKKRGLGGYIEILEDKKVDIKVTGMLRHLKDNYRNPIAHPEEFWDFDKAANALTLATSIIGTMIKNIQGIKSRKTSPIAQT